VFIRWYHLGAFAGLRTIQTVFALTTSLQWEVPAAALSPIDSSAIVRPHSCYPVAVAAGEVPGAGANHKFGYNKACAAGVDSDIWTGPTALYTGFLPAGLPLRIKAGGDALDDAAGTHARSVVLQGLDDNGLEISQTLATAGASASADTGLGFRRYNRGYVDGVGVFGNSNKAAITIETNTGITVGYIDITTGSVVRGQGQTQMAIWTVPADTLAVVETITAHVEGTKTADIYFWQRPNAFAAAAPFGAARIWHIEPALIGGKVHNFKSPPPFDTLTDIWVSAIAGAGGAKIAATFDIKKLAA